MRGSKRFSTPDLRGAAARRALRRSAIAIGLSLALVVPVTVGAQVPVIESRGVPPGAQRPQPVDARQAAERQAPAVRGVADERPTSSMAELFHQLQMMQIEIQELRGLVEEQAHQLERLARVQRDQYVDVDRRLQALQGGSAPAQQAPGGGGPAAPPRGAAAASETEDYTQAFDLTRERRFAEAIDAFERLIEQYPNGQYTANAWYWLGELYLALPEPRLDRSRQAFERVIEVYPSDQKVPDSLYKLGVVYHRQGDVNRARQHLQRVQREHAGTPAARLAEAYAAELR
jgi:tol-pal system protein YbgF